MLTGVVIGNNSFMFGNLFLTIGYICFNISLFFTYICGYGDGLWGRALEDFGSGSAVALNRFVLLFALPPAMFVFTAWADIGEF